MNETNIEKDVHIALMDDTITALFIGLIGARRSLPTPADKEDVMKAFDAMIAYQQRASYRRKRLNL